jgi:hypothetical protein
MGGIRLKLVDGLELVEPGLGRRKAELRRLLHETQLGVDVLQLLIVAQGVPVIIEFSN